MKIIADVTIEYSTVEELDSIQAKIPPSVIPIIDSIAKQISFTIIQEVAAL